MDNKREKTLSSRLQNWRRDLQAVTPFLSQATRAHSFIGSSKGVVALAVGFRGYRSLGCC
jgi:hypothetical protein